MSGRAPGKAGCRSPTAMTPRQTYAGTCTEPQMRPNGARKSWPADSIPCSHLLTPTFPTACHPTTTSVDQPRPASRRESHLAATESQRRPASPGYSPDRGEQNGRPSGGQVPEPTVDTVIRIGVLTPHGVPGPEVEFAAMAPGRLTVRVVRITGTTDAGGSGGPVSPADLATLATAPALDRAAGHLLTDPVEVIGYASTTSAYATGFDGEMAMVLRLSRLTGRPVAATCASAVHALRVLQVERVALVGAPWFAPGLNELGAAYFAGQGFGVVSSVSAGLPQEPRAVEPAAVCEWVS